MIDTSWPMPLTPRFDPKPWGGRRLEQLGMALPPSEPIGEAVVTAAEATVRVGPMAGRRLGELVAADPETLIGRRGLSATGGRSIFPLLVKLIDAAADLSIQVHPNGASPAADDVLGKTEAWHILAAEPDAALYLGTRSDVPGWIFEAACRAGTGAAGMLRRLPAAVGTTVLIPAGTVHALGAGTLVYEVQQPSDVTYRLDDWKRVGTAGKVRSLHLDEGFAVLEPSFRPELIRPVDLDAVGRRQLLAACRYFALERIALAAGEEVEARAPESPQALTCLLGTVEVLAVAGPVALGPGETAVVAAAARSFSLRALAPAVVLRAWIPDLVADVVDAACAAGASTEQMSRLAGPLADVRDVARAAVW